MEEQDIQSIGINSSKTLHEEYQEALLKSGIQAANLLNELIELKLMPDPRAKELAEVALEVIRLANTFASNPQSTDPSNPQE